MSLLQSIGLMNELGVELGLRGTTYWLAHQSCHSGGRVVLLRLPTGKDQILLAGFPFHFCSISYWSSNTVLYSLACSSHCMPLTMEFIISKTGLCPVHRIASTDHVLRCCKLQLAVTVPQYLVSIPVLSSLYTPNNQLPSSMDHILTTAALVGFSLYYKGRKLNHTSQSRLQPGLWMWFRFQQCARAGCRFWTQVRRKREKHPFHREVCARSVASCSHKSSCIGQRNGYVILRAAVVLRSLLLQPIQLFYKPPNIW